MPKGIFQVLGGVVGHLRKRPEGGDVDKRPVIEHTHVPGPGRTVPHGQGGGLLDLFGQAQGGGAVVGGPEGHIPQHRGMLQLHQARRGLAERAVPAGADYPVELPAQLFGDAGCVAFLLGGPDGHQIARFCKRVQYGGQLSLHLALAGGGIVKKQKLFHTDSPAYHFFSPL